METRKKARLAVSSWSLNSYLGSPPIYGVEAGITIPDGHGKGELSLLELPRAVAEAGIHTLEITHFHLPGRDSHYLAALRQALADAEVELFSLLVDAGDITAPLTGCEEMAWIADWLDVAAALGSEAVRVIAGKQAPTAETLALSAERLDKLADQAADLGLRLMTENWFATTAGPAEVQYLLDTLGGRVGLCLDFGNWQGADKYDRLEQIAPYSESCHAKAFFDKGSLNQADYTRCLDITRAAGLNGVYTLIFDSPDLDAWQGLAAEAALVKPYLS